MILAKVCPSCLAHAENKKAAARRKARFTCVSHPPALSKTETNREGARAKRILGLHRRLLQFFPCTGKNLRVHSHLPACSDPVGKNLGGGAAGNFRLRRTIFAKRGKPQPANRESKFQRAA